MTALHWSAWPSRDQALDPDGYVYVLEFSIGIIKVGRTTDPLGRTKQHQKDGARFGASITRHWLSPSHRAFHASEAALIAAASESGALVGGAEYFAGCSFDDLVATGRTLPTISSTAEQRAERVARAQAALDRLAEVIPTRGHVVRVESELVANLISAVLGQRSSLPPAGPGPSTADLIGAAQIQSEMWGIAVDQVLEMSHIDVTVESLVKLVRLHGDVLRSRARAERRWDLLASGHEQIANNADEAASQLATAGAR